MSIRRIMSILAAALILAALALPCLAEATQSAGEVTLFLNSRERFGVSGAARERVYHFTPATNGTYVFHALPGRGGDLNLQAALTDDAGSILSQGGGVGSLELRASLAAGETVHFTLRGEGSGQVTVEVMEDVYGRSVDQPLRLMGEDVAYVRAIVNPRQTHWYAYTAPRDGWYVIRSESSGGESLDTRGVVLDERLRELGQNDDILFPWETNFRMCLRLQGGRTYYIRVNALSNQTGAYRLIIAAPQNGAALPVSLSLSRTEMSLTPGETDAILARCQPVWAIDDVTYTSDRPDIATVDSAGKVTAVSAGECVIHVYAGHVEALCRVTVTAPPLESVSFAESVVSVAAGGSVALAPVFAPENAGDRALTFASSDEGIATVSEDGVVTGVSMGDAVITARSDGGITAACRVVVTAWMPAYRALVLGETNYDQGRVRLGGQNTAQGVADMLSRQQVNGQQYQVTLRIDSTREALIDAIDTAFADAQAGDISLFYINCHGDYDDTAWIELHDGTKMTAAQLEGLLRRIPGKVAVIVDCCRSGAFLSDDQGADRFTQAVCDAFAGSGEGIFHQSKYLVLTSASASEDSYRRSFTNDTTEESMATILARSLCEGAGWDLIGDQICTLKADANRDHLVTLQEIWQYTHRRVLYYLDGTGVTQSVQVWPEGDQTSLFGRG